MDQSVGGVYSGGAGESIAPRSPWLSLACEAGREISRYEVQPGALGRREEHSRCDYLAIWLNLNAQFRHTLRPSCRVRHGKAVYLYEINSLLFAKVFTKRTEGGQLPFRHEATSTSVAAQTTDSNERERVEVSSDRKGCRRERAADDGS